MCPEVVKAKDTPCKVIGPTATAANRMIISIDPKDKEIAELKAKIQQLEEAINVLQQPSK